MLLQRHSMYVTRWSSSSSSWLGRPRHRRCLRSPGTRIADMISPTGKCLRSFWTLWSLIALQMKVNSSKEFCLLESFEASCAEPSFILMLKAQYGRMSIGRCLKRDYYLGCSSDVTGHLDNQCTGKKYCRVPIPEQNLIKLLPCPGDLVAYLEAEYVCIREIGSSQQCLEDRYAQVTNLLGYLTTYFTFATEIGSESCPWRIVASSGQRINLTLINLNTVGVGNASVASLDLSTRTGSRQHCAADAIATVRETLEDGATIERMICRTVNRVASIYASQGDRLTVALSSAFRRDVNGSAKYILRYEVIGCREPEMPTGAYLTRSRDRAFIGCSGHRRSWNLLCRNNEWVGEIGECGQLNQDFLTKTDSVSTEDSSQSLFPSGLHSVGMWTALAIGVTVGVVVGICLLVALYSLQHRCMKNRENHFNLNNDNRKQTTTYNAIKRRACATRFFRLPKPGDSEDEVRLRYIHSQYICPHRTKNRTVDTAVYVDCPQTATTEMGFEPLSKKEKSLSFLDIKQSSIDSDDPAPNSSLTNQFEQSNTTSGLYSQSESLVRSASNVSSRSTNSITFSIPNKIDAF